MGIVRKTALISTLMLSSLSAFASGFSIEDLKNMNEAEKKEFIQTLGPDITNYLIQNPEFIIEASKNLQVREKEKETKSIINKANNNIDKLVNNIETPFIGNKDSDIVIVSFTDYNCVYCKKSKPVIEELIKNNPEVKFVFKEYPIFQNESEGSKFGALVAQKVFKDKGGEAYLKYHNELLSNESVNNVEQVVDAARSTGLSIDQSFKGIGDEEVKAINENIQLAGYELSISGTPAFLFINKSNPEKTQFISGLTTAENMQNIINSLSK